MPSSKRKYTIKFAEGVATSISAHAAAWTAVATVTFVWQFLGHVVADASFYIAATFAGY